MLSSALWCSIIQQISKNVHKLTRSDIKLMEFLQQYNLIFPFDGLCNQWIDRQLVLHIDNTTHYGYTWWCTSRRCNHKISFSKHSFFTQSKLPLSTITEINYYWAYRHPQKPGCVTIQ